MASPRAVTWLLLLLVLAPTGVLGWLGLQATDSFDAADAARLRADLEITRRALAEAVPRARAAVEAQVEVALADAAEQLALRLPMATDESSAGELLASTRSLDRVGLAPLRVRLLDAQGRVRIPATHRPADGGPGAGGGGHAPLLAALELEADRAYYGPPGLEGAVAVWARAREAFRGARLRAHADVQVARLRARGDPTGATAVREAQRLSEAWPQETLHAVGRPLLLLWLEAATRDGAWRAQLRASLRDGRAASTPLTAEERGRLVNVVTTGRLADDTLAGERGIPFERALAYGARLAVRIPWERLVVAMDAQLATVFPDRSHFTLFSPHQVEAAADDTVRGGLPTGGVLAVNYPGGVPRLLRYLHPEAAAAVSARAGRRLLVPVAVVCLFLVSVLGLALTARAVRRERAARRLRDEFIANVTHEVRTPLTSVLLHGEMLADEATDAERRLEHAEVVRAEGARLAALVDDLLDFAALERGTRRLEPVPVDLARACRDALAPYRVMAERDGTELACDVEGAAPVALADGTGLARILANLVGNAWKHGRPSRDGATGRIRMRVCEVEGRPAVEVRDDGPGIPASERGRVFERFARGRTAGATQGAGIGLALARDLARAMGGDLEGLDAPGETVFRLTLPPVPEIEA